MGASSGTVFDSKDKWVCLSINERFSSREHYPDVRAELQSILGRGSSVLIVGEQIGDDCFENAFMNYVFVRCKDIYARRKELMASRYVKGILHSFTDIHFIDQSEIDEMTSSWKTSLAEKQIDIMFGDVVHVRSGTFEKLHGVVVGRKGVDYMVRFRLFTKDLTTELPASMLEPGDNVFHLLKFPVTT